MPNAATAPTRASAAPKPDTETGRKRFKDLTRQEKMAFFAKLTIFLITFGFAFPLLLSD
jgi:hypothetical protein